MLTVAFIAWIYRPRPAPDPGWSGDYDVTARQPQAIAPGTTVGQAAPKGWSHLVIKSLPRVRSGEEVQIPLLIRDQSVRMASWMFTVFTADVRPEHEGQTSGYRLVRVGMGLGTNSGGRDIVITPETAAEHGVGTDLDHPRNPDQGIQDSAAGGRGDPRPDVRARRYSRLVSLRGEEPVDSFSLCAHRGCADRPADTAVWLLDSEGHCG